MSTPQETKPDPGQRCRTITPSVKKLEVAAGILWRGGRFLAAQRPPGSVQQGFWEFPGGKIEPGEAPAQGLARELREELGVGISQPLFWRLEEHVYADPPRHVLLHFFHVHDFTGEPCSREGQALRWVTRAEALDLPFLAADIPVLHALEEGDFSKD